MVKLSHTITVCVSACPCVHVSVCVLCVCVRALCVCEGACALTVNTPLTTPHQPVLVCSLVTALPECTRHGLGPQSWWLR